FSFLRAMVQVFILGLMIFFIFSLMGFYILLLLLGMVVVAAHIASKRSVKILHLKSFWVSLVSISFSSFFVLGFSLLLGILDPSASFIIPLGGMVIGNSMLRCGIAYERLGAEIKRNRDVIETYLSLGANWREASEVFIKNSRRASLLPSLDNLRASGVVWIPGLMAGMILAGANPIWAAEIQIVIFLMLFSTAMLTVLMATELLSKAFFNEREQLVI
ncbi:MAG TPA: iron export ABC transporter permease subunit FetB, partial [Thermoplasmata archaeon]|nr:iron export ABC transporter permease subunit FetB [Thermoplasmata archaeon]